jgi:phosphoribosylamine---glycine ligase
MNVLVIGSGGREHALVWKISQSPRVDQIWCAPGNAGIGQIAQLADLKANNIPGLVALAQELQIDLTVVGPEEPLTLGIVDAFRAEGLLVFGPNKAAAELEGSKVFSKDLMLKYGIPTAAYAEFSELSAARDYLQTAPLPTVVKADGLAAGKGVIIAQTKAEAEAAARAMLEEQAFGTAGKRIIIEEFLEGREATIMAFAAGTEFHAMPPAQDHKPAFDGDQGPNTGGMGCYSPVPMITPELQKEAEEKVIAPTLQALTQEKRPYFGILYAGLILTKDGLKVLEYNCRFGDPEAEVILPRLESDLMEQLVPIAQGRFSPAPQWSERAATCVVMAAGGYPGKYETGKAIAGLEEAAALEDVIVFHSATKKAGAGFVTSGGRVLAVTGRGENPQAAIDRAYAAVGKISWENVHYRRDIGAKANR